MMRFVLTLIVVLFSNIVMAQVRATTERGNKVILFDNGTWKYEEKKSDTQKNNDSKENNPVPAASVSATAKISVDNSIEVQTDYEILYTANSKRLERFFGEEKSKTRCKVSCSNNKGKVSLHFLWEFPVGDGNRYYGYLKEESLITLHLPGDQKLALRTAERATVQTREQFNFTAIKCYTKALTPEQLQVLLTQPILKFEVDWKKTPEVYEVDANNYFINKLPNIL